MTYMEKLQEAAKAVKPTDIKVSHSGNSRFSFGIVNSARNGKRVTLSKGLATALSIGDSADMVPIAAEGVLMIGKKLSFPATSTVSLKEDGGGKIGYNSGMVAVLTQVFGLNFTEHVSVSYSDINMDHLDDGTLVAIVKIHNKYPNNSDTQVSAE